MKTARLVSLLLLAFHTFGLLANAQSNTAAGQKALPSQTVTLFSHVNHPDPSGGNGKSAFSFKHGLRSDVGRTVTRNQYELLYGFINLNGDSDWFSVSMGRDERSRIKDLGPRDWSEIGNLPVLSLEAGREEGIRFPSQTETFEESSKGRVTRVAAGHVYLFRSKDPRSDLYILFRVEELLPSDQVTLSWRAIPSPTGSNVQVIQQKWRMDVHNPALDKSPLEAMDERQRAERQRRAVERLNESLGTQGMPGTTVIVPDPPRDKTPRGLQVTYIYEVKLTNGAKKPIRSLVWEYLFFEPGTEQEVGRRRFESKINIGAGKTTTLIERSASPPTGSIDARHAGKKREEQYSEQIVIESVEYADGSFWRRPSQ